ncbi:MAG: LlaJI family restriction endonuclease, partial [Acetivibrio ethanolgignens]
MKIVSSYVREQKRYTKNDLKTIFSFDESGVEKFIKNLKAYGVLKSVKNNTDQLEMSDLMDEDIEITDETAESGDCLYVFTYVGIITCGSRVIKVFPKYLLSKKEAPLDEMKQVVKVLERYSRSEEQIINVFNGNGENRSFNILAVILFLLNDYYEYGIYTNSEEIVEINGEGEILWGKTIDE